MANAGKIIAEAEVVYKGDGVEAMKKDIASLEEATGSAGESAGSLSDALATLDETAGKAAESTGGFVEAMGAMEKPAGVAEEAVSGMNEALGESQSVIEDTGKSLENAQKPLESYTQSIQSLSDTIGSPHFSENMSAFQDALENPYPFQMIQGYLDETGQSWGDFTGTIGDSNVQMLHEMAANADTTHEVLGGMSADFQTVGKSAQSSLLQSDPTVWTEAMHQAGLETMGLGSAVEDTGKAMKSSGFGGFLSEVGGGFGQIFGEAGTAFGGLMSGLNAIAMPIMAVQMIGMAVGAIGQGIYDAAAIAEGPAAHGVGSFTGAIDQLTQSSQKAGQQFSESFGQNILPTINAINNVSSQKSGNDFWGQLGADIGATGNLFAAAGLGIGGFLVMDTFDPKAGRAMQQAGQEALANTVAQSSGEPQPYVGSVDPNYNPYTVGLLQQTAALQEQISSPAYKQYIAAQAQAASMQQIAQQNQLAYNDSHYTGTISPSDPMNDIFQSQAARANGQAYGMAPGNTSDIAQNAAYFDSLLPANMRADQYGNYAPSGGCFIAGTRVLMADGTERSIEKLNIGDQITAHDGTKQVTTTVLARIFPPPKQVYTLIFANGSTLTLTDSHPISTPQGWKSISPDATRQENTDLVVSILQRGDTINIVSGVTHLVDIEQREVVQVYNITVDDPHTFYANKVLVHNKSSMDTYTSNAGSDNTVVTHTFTAQVSWEASNLAKQFTAQAMWQAAGDLAHTFEGVADWVASGGLQHTFEGIADWVASGGLQHTFEGIADWVANGGLQHTFEGIADWVANGGLQHTFEGIADWVASGGLQHTFEGAADWVGKGLSNIFTGTADWDGKDLNHLFNAQPIWNASNLNPVFNVAASFIGLPMFSSGIRGFGGGVAVVGEKGPEIVTLPAGSSVYPNGEIPGVGDQGTGIASLLGGGSATGGSGAIGPITIQLIVDSQILAQQTVPHIASMMRLQFGARR